MNWLAGLIFIIIVFVLIFKIRWITLEQQEEVARLENLAHRANEGHEGARIQCDDDFRILKGMVYKDGKIIPRYKVSPEAISRIHGF